MNKVLLIDGSGLLFIKNETDIHAKIELIKQKAGIDEYRLFLKKEINNKSDWYNNRKKVYKSLVKKHNAIVCDNAKQVIADTFNTDTTKYVVASLSEEMFKMVTGQHFDYYYKRMCYVYVR